VAGGTRCPRWAAARPPTESGARHPVGLVDDRAAKQSHHAVRVLNLPRRHGTSGLRPTPRYRRPCQLRSSRFDRQEITAAGGGAPRSCAYSARPNLRAKHGETLALSARLYNPSTHQWAIYGSSIKTGVFDPPVIGQFRNGRGQLYSQDTLQGRAIYVRFIWQSIDANRTRMEQAFSEDGGKTWETNWIYEGQRITE
jgi:hypothetical protein